MIEPAKHINAIRYKKGKTSDIIRVVIDTYNKDYMQVESACKTVEGDVLSRCKYVFDLIDKNVIYTPDPFGRQWVKSPARLWSDKTGDCKSYSVFIASCLRCLGIAHFFRFTAYRGGKEPTHVYVVAVDESGKEIIVDPVYRENGIAQFNKECKYTYKKDMSGTTEISYLSGLGYPGQDNDTIMITASERVRTRQEVDFYVNLNLLNSLYQIVEDNQKHLIRNKMDIAASAINVFEIADQGLTTNEQGLTCLLSLVRDGVFDLPDLSTDADHEQLLKIVYGRIVNSSDISSDSAAFYTLYNITGADLVDDIVKVSNIPVSPTLGGLGDINSGYAQWEKDFNSISYTDKNKAAAVASSVRILKESAAYFMYTFIPDSEISQYKEIVEKKRSEHFKILQKIQSNNLLTVAQCEAVIFLEIKKVWGLDPKSFLKAIKDGVIPVIGDPVSIAMAIIGLLISLLAAIAPLIAPNNEDELIRDIHTYAPSDSDGLYTGQPGWDLGGNGSGFNTAGSTLVPLLLVGGVVMALVTTPDKKKKKKK